MSRPKKAKNGKRSSSFKRGNWIFFALVSFIVVVLIVTVSLNASLKIAQPEANSMIRSPPVVLDDLSDLNPPVAVPRARSALRTLPLHRDAPHRTPFDTDFARPLTLPGLPPATPRPALLFATIVAYDADATAAAALGQTLMSAAYPPHSPQPSNLAASNSSGSDIAELVRSAVEDVKRAAAAGDDALARLVRSVASGGGGGVGPFAATGGSGDDAAALRAATASASGAAAALAAAPRVVLVPAYVPADSAEDGGSAGEGGGAGGAASAPEVADSSVNATVGVSAATQRLLQDVGGWQVVAVPVPAALSACCARSALFMQLSRITQSESVVFLRPDTLVAHGAPPPASGMGGGPAVSVHGGGKGGGGGHGGGFVSGVSSSEHPLQGLLIAAQAVGGGFKANARVVDGSADVDEVESVVAHILSRSDTGEWGVYVADVKQTYLPAVAVVPPYPPLAAACLRFAAAAVASASLRIVTEAPHGTSIAPLSLAPTSEFVMRGRAEPSARGGPLAVAALQYVAHTSLARSFQSAEAVEDSEVRSQEDAVAAFLSEKFCPSANEGEGASAAEGGSAGRGGGVSESRRVRRVRLSGSAEGDGAKAVSPKLCGAQVASAAAALTSALLEAAGVDALERAKRHRHAADGTDTEEGNATAIKAAEQELADAAARLGPSMGLFEHPRIQPLEARWGRVAPTSPRSAPPTVEDGVVAVLPSALVREDSSAQMGPGQVLQWQGLTVAYQAAARRYAAETAIVRASRQAAAAAAAPLTAAGGGGEGVGAVGGGGKWEVGPVLEAIATAIEPLVSTLAAALQPRWMESDLHLLHLRVGGRVPAMVGVAGAWERSIERMSAAAVRGRSRSKGARGDGDDGGRNVRRIGGGAEADADPDSGLVFPPRGGDAGDSDGATDAESVQCGMPTEAFTSAGPHAPSSKGLGGGVSSVEVVVGRPGESCASACSSARTVADWRDGGRGEPTGKGKGGLVCVPELLRSFWAADCGFLAAVSGCGRCVGDMWRPWGSHGVVPFVYDSAASADGKPDASHPDTRLFHGRASSKSDHGTEVPPSISDVAQLAIAARPPLNPHDVNVTTSVEDLVRYTVGIVGGSWEKKTKGGCAGRPKATAVGVSAAVRAGLTGAHTPLSASKVCVHVVGDAGPTDNTPGCDLVVPQVRRLCPCALPAGAKARAIAGPGMVTSSLTLTDLDAVRAVSESDRVARPTYAKVLQRARAGAAANLRSKSNRTTDAVADAVAAAVLAKVRGMYAIPSGSGVVGVLAALRGVEDRLEGSVDPIAADAAVADALGDANVTDRVVGGSPSEGGDEAGGGGTGGGAAGAGGVKRKKERDDADEDAYGRRRAYIRPTYAPGSHTPCDTAFSAYTPTYDTACERWLQNISNIVDVIPMESNLVTGRTIKFKALYKDGITAVLKVPQEMFPLEPYSEFVSYKFDRLMFQRTSLWEEEGAAAQQIASGAATFDRDTYAAEVPLPPPSDQSSANVADPLNPHDVPDPRVHPPAGNGYVPITAWVDVPVAWLYHALRISLNGDDVDHVAWLLGHLFAYTKRSGLQHPITVRQSDVLLPLVAPPEPPLPPHTTRAWMKPSGGGGRKGHALPSDPHSADTDVDVRTGGEDVEGDVSDAAGDGGGEESSSRQVRRARQSAARVEAHGGATGGWGGRFGVATSTGGRSGAARRDLKAFGLSSSSGSSDPDAPQVVNALGVSVQLWMADVGTFAKSDYGKGIDRPTWHDYAEPTSRQLARDGGKSPWFEPALSGLVLQAMYDYILGNIDRNLHKNQHVIGGCARSCDDKIKATKGGGTSGEVPAATGADVVQERDVDHSGRREEGDDGHQIGAGCVMPEDPLTKAARHCDTKARLHEGWPAMTHLDQGWAFYLPGEPTENVFAGDSKVCFFSQTVVDRLHALLDGTFGADSEGVGGVGIVEALWAVVPANVQAKVTKWHMNLLVDRTKKLLRKVDACVKKHGKDAVFRWV